MSDSVEDRKVDQFIVYAAYGEVMHQLQILEMSLGQILLQRLKPGTSFDQAMARVEKWDSTTFGDLMRGMRSQTHWPADMVEELDQAVRWRNYLAHHFLLAYFLRSPSIEVQEHALNDLSVVSNRVASLQ